MIAGLLEKNFGFPDGNITLLRDKEAARGGSWQHLMH